MGEKFKKVERRAMLQRAIMRQHKEAVKQMKVSNPFIFNLLLVGKCTDSEGAAYRIFAVEYSNEPLDEFAFAPCVYITRPVAEGIDTLCSELSNASLYCTPAALRALSVVELPY